MLSITVLILLIATCKSETSTTTRGTYNWTRVFAEESDSLLCVYGAVDRDNQTLVNNGMALRYCNEYGNWEEVDLRDCLTFTKSRLISIAEVCILFLRTFQHMY